MRIGHVELAVANPLESMSFYVDILGLTCSANQGDQFIWIQGGGIEILLKPRGPATPDTPGGPGPFLQHPNLCFYVEDLPAELERLRGAGVAPVEDDPGCHYVRDPDGYLIQLVDPKAHG